MAKMFYTLQEAAEKLGKSEDELKAMADSGQLQQFRDRDKLMFKRDQVDSLAGDEGDTEEIKLDQPADTSKTDTDTIDLISETETEEAAAKKDSPKSATATGISVFEADEVEAADPMAQTQVTKPFGMDDDLTLDSVGSGSGLLDLTRESDDTSLGAVELLDESPDGSAVGAAMPGSSTGIFDVAGGIDSAPSGLGELESQAAGAPGAHFTVPYVLEETEDPPGDGLGGGIVFGTFAVLVVVAIITVTAHNGLIIKMTEWFKIEQKENSGWPYIVMAIACLIFGGIGWFIGTKIKASRPAT